MCLKNQLEFILNRPFHHLSQLVQHVCTVVQLIKITYAVQTVAHIWIGKFLHDRHIDSSDFISTVNNLPFCLNKTDACCVYKRVVLVWPLWNWPTSVHVRIRVPYVNRVRSIVKVHRKMGQRVAAMATCTIQRAKWNCWRAARVWCGRIGRIVKAHECVASHVGALHGLHAALTVASMRAHVKCVQRIVANMCSKFPCPTVWYSNSALAQQQTITLPKIVPLTVWKHRNNWYAAAMDTFTVQCVNWKCWVVGKWNRATDTDRQTRWTWT